MDVIVFRRTGNWVIGALVQENEDGKKRIKVFKGRVRPDGHYSAVYKGEELRFNLSQRLNIPSKRYWDWLKEHVDIVVRKHLSGESSREEEGGRTLLDYV